jgi:hypothetical protein
MSEDVKRHFHFRKSAYWTMGIYVLIDLLTSFHTWLLEIKDRVDSLGGYDYTVFSVQAILSVLLMVKALQNGKWQATTPPPK